MTGQGTTGPKPERYKIAGDRVRRFRTALGLTQMMLQERTGLAQSYISQIEGGTDENVTLDTINKLASGLDVDLVDIILDRGQSRRASWTPEFASALDALANGRFSPTEQQNIAVKVRALVRSAGRWPEAGSDEQAS